MLGKAGASTLGTNLIIHHGITDILNQASELVYILSAVQESCDLASLFQWGEGLKDIIQFPGRLHIRLAPTTDSMELPFENIPSRFFLDLTLGYRCT